MKQTFAVIILVVFAACLGVYFWLPTQQIIPITMQTKAGKGALQRCIANNDIIKTWMPIKAKSISNNQYEIDGCTITFTSDILLNTDVRVQYKNIDTSSLFRIDAYDNGATASLYFITKPAKNFVEKCTNFFTARHVKKVLNSIMSNYVDYVNNSKKVYGVQMQKVLLKDSLLIATKNTVTHYPTVQDIYVSIGILKNYATTNKAIQTNAPMLNIYKLDTAHWEYMVALPINLFLPNYENIKAKRMLAGGNIIETDSIVGGFNTVEKYLQEIENYKSDFNYMSPAIPFQLLVTDRMLEKDSTKWITKLYYPVF